MAEKKPDKKPAPKPSGAGGGEAQMVFIAVIAVVVVFVVAPTIMIFLGYSGSYSGVTNNFGEKVSNTFTSFVDIVGLIAIFISLMFIMGMIYAKTRLNEIKTEYSNRLHAIDQIGKPKPLQSDMSFTIQHTSQQASQHAPSTISGQMPVMSTLPTIPTMSTMTDATKNTPENFGGSPFEQYMNSRQNPAANSQNTPVVQTVNPRWAQIEKNMQSHNVSEWRFAILEADILLYDMLSQMGYEGNSIGEILKNVDKANFVTLDDAWKAHRIRNIIAHEGANYELSRDEAERTIRLFKRVFDEFYFV